MKRIAPANEAVYESSSFVSVIQEFFRNWGIQSLTTAFSLLLIFNFSFNSESLDFDNLYSSSFESEIISYGYSDNTFNLSKVLGYSNLEELQ